MASYKWPASGGGSSSSITSLTGDVVATGPGAAVATIQPGVVTLAKMANLAANSFIGNNTGSAATPLALTVAQAKTLLNLAGTNSGDVTLTAVGAVPNANGASLSTQALTLQPANTSFPGVLTAADWNTFNNKQATITQGNLTEATSSVLTITGGTSAVIGSGASIQVKQSSSSVSGYLSSTDWSTFNSKGSGTVTAVSVVSANGFAGSSGGGATPALTLTTTITGILSGNGTAISAASTTGSGSVVLATSPTIVTPTIAKLANLTTNGFVKTSAGDGTLSVDTTAYGTGSVTSVAATVPAFLSISGSPVTTTGTLAIGLSGTALPIANGGTAVTSVTTAPTASAWAGWDANANLSADSFIQGYTTTATAAGTTTLTVTSTYTQIFTGSTTQTLKLPVASTLVLGQQFAVWNQSTAAVTVQSSGANTIVTMAGASLSLNQASYAEFTCILTSGTGTASWSCQYFPAQDNAAIASTVMLRDSSKNTNANNFIANLTTAATSGGTTTLTKASSRFQQFTGSSNQTIVLADTSATGAGYEVKISNRSTGVLTVNNSNAGTLVQSMLAGTDCIFTAFNNSGDAWNTAYSLNAVSAPVNPTVQKFTSGSGNYTTPTGVQYIIVRMVGGGGGGATGGTSGLNAGGTGGTSTFGTQLSCVGGTGGAVTSGGALGGAGGTSTLGTGPIGVATPGSAGGGVDSAAASVFGCGGSGGNAPYYSGSGAGGARAAGLAGSTNTGGGGGGGATSGSSGGGGGGGGSGGFVYSVLFPTAAQVFAYAVGAAGTAGAVGTGGYAGGAGAAGYIEVTEFYSNVSISSTTSVAAGTFLAGPTSGSSTTPTFRALQTPTVQKFTSGSSNYTTPAGALWIKVRMVGGGGGGAGSGTGSAGNGGTGGTSTFGAQLSCVGGTGAVSSTTTNGGAGGTSTLGTGPIGSAFPGGSGGASALTPSGAGCGGVNPFGGGGGGGANTQAGQAGATNTGAGGGGGGSGTALAGAPGGGAGGFVDAIIVPTAAQVFAYAVGAAGAAGTAGTSGFAAGAGAAGYIEVIEYYQ